MGLRFDPQTNTSHILELLTTASAKTPDKFSVFTHETMPPAYHFSHHPRIAPLYIVPKLGYALTNRKEGDSRLTKGVRHLDKTAYDTH
jgi:Type I phosphodiesterase / nucleotide pyrophosphatase